jgi:O-antigen/teichoic acid export membrane protein
MSPPRVTTLSKNVIFNLVGQALALAIGFIAVRFIFRQLGPDIFGIIYFNITLAAVLTTVLELGVLATTVREISSHYDTEPGYIISLIRTASLLYWSVGVVVVVVVFLIAPLLVEKWINLTSIDAGTAATLLRILSVGTMVALPRALYTSLFRGRQRMAINNVIDLATAISQQLGVVLLLRLGSGPYLIAAWLSASVLISIVAYLVIAGRLFSWRAMIPGFDSSVVRRNLRFTTLMMSNSLLATVLNLTDKLVVSKLLAVSEFGLYGFASATIGRATLVTAAIGQAALPAFSSLFKKGYHVELLRQYHKLQDLVCYGTLPMFGAIVFGAIPAYTYLFNSTIAERLLLPTAFLALGFYMSAAVYTAYTVSVAMGKPQILLRANVLAVFMVVPVTVLLILAYGITGAAASLVFYQAFAFLYVVPRICRQCLQIRPMSWYAHFFKAFGLGVALYGIAWGLVAFSDSYSVLNLTLAYLASTGAFAIGAYFAIGPDTRATLTRTVEAARQTTLSPAFSTYIVVVTGVALALVVGGLTTVHSGWTAIPMVAAVVTAAAVFVRVLGLNVGLVVLLITTCFIDRDTFAVGGLNIRPEQIGALVALVVLVAQRLRAGRFELLRPNLAEVALGLWFGIGLVSSLLSAPSRGQSLKLLALLVLSSLAFLLPRRLLDRRDEVDEVVRLFLLAFAAEATYGLFAYFLHLFGPTVSLSVNPGTDHLNAYGTLWEPNVFGAICSAGAVAWVYFGRKHFNRPWIGVALCLSGTVISFTRAAWLAALAVLALSVALSLRRKVDLGSLIKGGAAALLSIVAVTVVDQPAGYSVAGLGRSIGNKTDIIGRSTQFGSAWSDLQHRILLGGGIDSYGQRHMVQGLQEHLGNLELAVANDTGLLGLLVLALFIGAVVATVWRNRRDWTVIGLAATTLVIALTNQATETMELMITWLMLGLLVAACQTANRISSEETVRTAPDSGS